MRSLALRKGESINDMRNTGVMTNATPAAVSRDDPRLSGYCVPNVFFCFQNTENGFGFAKEIRRIAAVLIFQNTGEHFSFFLRKTKQKNLQNYKKKIVLGVQYRYFVNIMPI